MTAVALQNAVTLAVALSKNTKAKCSAPSSRTLTNFLSKWLMLLARILTVWTAILHSYLYKPHTGSTGFLLDSRPLKMGPAVCPETSVSNYNYSYANNPHERNTTHLTSRTVPPHRTCSAIPYPAVSQPRTAAPSASGNFSDTSVWRPCIISGGQLPASHLGGTGSVPSKWTFPLYCHVGYFYL